MNKHFDDMLDNILDKKPEKIVNHVVFLMDHSGSMVTDGRHNMALDNFNEQIQELKKQSDKHNQPTMVSLIEFSTDYNIIFWEESIHTVFEIDKYRCYGGTALNDTIVKTINKMEKEIPELDDKEKNHSVLLIIMTDGEENASVEFSGIKGKEVVKAIIDNMEKKDNWTFTFMGANLDIQSEIVHGRGFSIGNTMSFTSDVDGFRKSRIETMSGINHYYTSRSAGEKKVDDFYTIADKNSTTWENPDTITYSTTNEGDKNE